MNYVINTLRLLGLLVILSPVLVVLYIWFQLGTTFIFALGGFVISLIAVIIHGSLRYADQRAAGETAELRDWLRYGLKGALLIALATVASGIGYSLYRDRVAKTGFFKQPDAPVAARTYPPGVNEAIKGTVEYTRGGNVLTFHGTITHTPTAFKAVINWGDGSNPETWVLSGAPQHLTTGTTQQRGWVYQYNQVQPPCVGGGGKIFFPDLSPTTGGGTYVHRTDIPCPVHGSTDYRIKPGVLAVGPEPN